MKILTSHKNRIAALVLLFGLVIPFAPAHAAVDRAVLNIQPDGNGDGRMTWVADFFDGTTYVTSTGDYFSVATTTTPDDYINKAQVATLGWAAANGMPGISSVVFPYIRMSEVNAAIASATSSIPVNQALSFGTSTRALNSAFQVSSTRASFVSYTVDVATTLSISGGQTGTVTLQYADDSGFTTNVKSIQSSVNGNTGTLTVGLALTQTSTASLTGMIPAGKYVRIATANTAGTPTFTFRAAQEVLMPSN